MSAWLVCPSVQSPSGSIRWRQTLWCRHQVTVVSGRRGPKTWYHKPPTLLQDAGTPVARHCHHDNYPHASLRACFRHRACGLWMHHGNAAGRGDGAVGRLLPAEGSWSRSDLRKRSKGWFQIFVFDRLQEYSPSAKKIHSSSPNCTGWMFRYFKLEFILINKKITVVTWSRFFRGFALLKNI